MRPPRSTAKAYTTMNKKPSRKPLFIVVLDTMWGARKGTAPRWFEINPHNKSGRLIYDICDGWDYFFDNRSTWGAGSRTNCVRVTNACRELVTRADQHGTPDPVWLTENLDRLSRDRKWRFATLVVGGAVAKRTYLAGGFKWPGRVVFIPHPAARNWSKKRIEETRRLLNPHLA